MSADDPQSLPTATATPTPTSAAMSTPRPPVIIIGGGAAGLELACRLGRRFGPQRVTLVDTAMLHVWKPSLHEVAAGTLDVQREGLSYFHLGRTNGFQFVPGALAGIDRERREVLLDAWGENGQQVLPARRLPYQYLVIATGARNNFFGTPGAAEHAISLDSAQAAEDFRRRLLSLLLRADYDRTQGQQDTVQIVIVGGGATGVELAAELWEALRRLRAYSPRAGVGPLVQITLLEAGPRLLAPLPIDTAQAAHRLLEQRGIRVRVGVKVAEVTARGVRDASGTLYQADLCVWAAGVQAAPGLDQLGLGSNRLRQIPVDPTLRTSDPHIYAIGDCAEVPWLPGRPAPARAQAAHQQASYLAKNLIDLVEDRTPSPAPFVYKDHGSLVSLGAEQGVGSLMGAIFGRGLFVYGTVARVMYSSLHFMHHWAVLGLPRAVWLAIVRFFSRLAEPRVKLH